MELSRSDRAPLPSGLRAKTRVARNGRAAVAARRVDAPGFSHMIGGSMLDRSAALCALTIVAGPLFASATLIPGSGSPRTECYVQLDLDSPIPPETRQRAFCVDGHPACAQARH